MISRALRSSCRARTLSCRSLAEDDLKTLNARKDTLIEEIKILLIPKDPNDEKNVILEVRAGTGGEEAALFAAELFRMYHAARGPAGVEI